MAKFSVFGNILTIILLTNFQNFQNVSAKNILFFHTAATASHRTAIWPLTEKLANSGHNITYIFPISKNLVSHPNIEELKPSLVLAAVEHFVGDFDINIRLNNTVDQWLYEAFSKIVDFCDAFYSSPETIEWLARPNLHYDLVMMDGGFGQCAYGLVHKFKAKHVLFNPITLPFSWDAFGIVPESSSIPEMQFHQKPDKIINSLWSRTLTTLTPFLFRIGFLGSGYKFEKIYKKHLNLTDMPSFEEIESQTSLVLHNSYFIEDYPMSLPPMFVSYSGLLCSKSEIQKRKPLPKNLEQFVNDNKTDGFIYVSFGSSVLVSAMPDDLRNQFFDAFSKFENLKFLWRWAGQLPENIPKNVLFQPWFPQQDLLSHPKIRAFISQAGRPSTQEALCYSVPMITYPIFGDQDLNADRLEDIGVSVSLDITEMSTEKLTSAIKEILENDKYQKRMKQLSEMYRDRPVDPLENAFYWIEYVLKYDTSLLKPLGMKQTWWQRRLLDVYALILVIFTAFFITIGFLFYYLCKFFKRILNFTNGKSINVKPKFE